MSVTAAQSKRSQWSSRFAFIMVTAGAAVGLGNIWKFPYMAGNNGGGIFVLLYLFFIFTVGVPAMIAELIMGRRGRQNAVNSIATLAIEANCSPRWQGLGWLGSVTLILVLSFYSVVAGWSIAYLFYAIDGLFTNATPTTILTIWETLLASPNQLLLWHSIFIMLTMGVVALGINKGIEKASEWMMPALFLILIFLVIFAAFKGDFFSAWRYLFSFKLEEITLRAVVDALGQAFFSLATGAGAILIYGSYLSREVNIVNNVLIITILDVLVAFLAGLAIFPIVYSHGLTPEGGPGLMFHILPISFSHMPFSGFIGSLFFILLIFAAWTSSISMGEPLVALLEERWKISRKRGAFCVGLFAWFLGLASVYSFNYWADIKLFGKWTIFTAITDISTNILLPIGAFLFCVFVGWKMQDKHVRNEFGNQPEWLYQTWRFSIRYVAPLGILVVLIANFF